MKFLSGLITVGSGAVGGLVASHNKGGNYFRALVIPVNPQTPQQVLVRNSLSQLVGAWTNTLTQLQRDAWDLYALNVPVTDVLGQTISLSGQQHFIRSNVPRIQGLDTGIAGAILDGPTIFNTGEVDSSAFFNLASPSTSTYTFDNTLAWANEDNALLLTWYGRPVNASVTFFKGPYNIGPIIAGNATTAPTSPAVQTTPFVYAVGQRANAYSRISRADGRLSAAFVLFRQIVT